MGEKPEITVGTDSPAISLQRTFDAPPSRVFEAFTRAEGVERWFRPSGLRLLECEIDLRVGGSWRVALRGPQGETHRLGGEYREIDPPRRLVQTLRSDDAPQIEAVETLVFTEVDGKTRLTSAVDHMSMEGRDRHIASGLEKRAAQLLDRLDEHLQFGSAAAETESDPPFAAPADRKPARIGPIAAALAALVALVGAGAYWTSHREPSGGAAAPASAARKVSASGSLVAVGAVPLRAGLAGAIELVDCEVGGEVAVGTVCATIDERDHEAARDRAETALAAAQERLQSERSRVELATDAVEREKRAGKRRAGARAADKAQAALADAQRREAQAETAFNEAQAAFASAIETVTKSRILSSIDGAVVSRNAEVGAKVAEADELFVVAPAPLALQIEAHAADASAVHVGDKASFTVDALGDRAFTGTVAKLGEADLVVIDAADPDHALKPGMTANVEIETGARPQ
ncbi:MULTISPECIES: SRPBCC domain-containing protein [Methylosinus]|uniref:Activator of Hsp90 ATPase homologue 1/2-like C-terminal domain-containing protein n=1 Tax=Methylosinus trichosporium (strain ATCC 35070 / NCIMB 11131 / UNIQEM 75 / OB3b) TaxID=595536 RepID=A0A2D2CVQ7_METT3|nr:MULTISPECIES: SRPBCC domain-containing protein [Methylosinus]ATQ66872.1 hypothetical protein CQW49_02395 [Methylosinus trichosporium OB3b]OBS54259.1 hypothetical protein A8B73_01310 [Methylosinus sp. 3S-1]